ncbi:MAG: Hsp20/alpha crystallin family protein [Deltaproteobacteria bacterium]|nr:Hsp20/alpha crystallin family protein [Deltaproteobacteria bacterium]MBW1948119.1 Hsp20/alpha crystallin family protein [Deltaproteobacteria bacterium]MBW2008234.1 Hsp20/alpha crystallin family protein [Deltaproteobacteria bacterium]
MSDLLQWQREEMDKMRRDMDRLFDDLRSCFENTPYAGRGVGAPSARVYETPDAVIVHAEIPGFEPEEIDLSLTEDTLTIRGEKVTGRLDARCLYPRLLGRLSSFSRTIRLPSRVNADEARATYEDGELRVVMPKWKREKVRFIRIEMA